NVGNVLGFTAELYQREILTKEALDGLDLRWGNTDTVGGLLYKIANREGIGDILAEGTYKAAVKLGKAKNMDLLKYAVQVKGIGVGAHDIRSDLDYTIHVSYAVSVHGIRYILGSKSTR
ncbi:MAG: aldehyde ferredoxin oxidoreductase C-terminal domain-containing protein, partial [Candidatus Njordarchaeum guaymaensis]